MGENGGPAPASENLINTIPTVRVTREQARMLFSSFFLYKRKSILNNFVR
jgi:hypothetical protein